MSAMVWDLVRAVVSPRALMRDIGGTRPMRYTIAFLVGLSLAYVLVARIAGLTLGMLSRTPGYSLDRPEYVRASLLVAIAAPVVGITGVACVALVILALARVVGGSGDYGSTFTVCAYAAVPLAAVSIVTVPIAVANPSKEPLVYTLFLLGFLWSALVAAVGVHVVQRLSVPRTFAAMALPFAVIAIALLESLFGPHGA